MDDIFGQIIEGGKYALPALVTAFVTYYFLVSFFRHEEKKQLLLAKRDLKKHSLPIRLQAYERLAMFLERISPSKLVQNVQPKSEDKKTYEMELVYQIQGEYEHNLSQQIYVSSQCWNMITTSKNATIYTIQQIASDEEVKTAQDLQRMLIEKTMSEESPSNLGLEYIRNEVNELL